MANQEQVNTLKALLIREGVNGWNIYRRQNSQAIFDLSGVDFTEIIGRELNGLDLTSCNLNRAIFSRANLTEAILDGTELIDANFMGACLTNSSLVQTNLIRANLINADVKGGVLNNANLSGALLRGVDFSDADLTVTNLSGATLSDCKLANADLHLSYASGADFRNANLKYINFSKANLIACNFSQANFSNANFTEAELGGTVFGNNDLSTIRGLETVKHFAPSTLGIDTIYRSNGKIPDAFLRGIGMPPSLILFAQSLIDKVFDFYSCFISYSTKDEAFAKRLYSHMIDNNISVWFAPEDVKSGQKLHEQIDQAIRFHDKLLVVLSENSLQSEWVKTEIRKARKAEIKESRRKLFPIRLVDFDAIRNWECFDADTGKDLAVEIREYYIPDFSSWKNPNAFKKAFDRLIRDLRAEGLPYY